VLRFLPEILAVIMVVLAILGLVHQQLTTSDVWFHLGQLRNHETIIACCIVGAVALVVGKYLGKIRL
jgi:hypothetical protein